MLSFIKFELTTTATVLVNQSNFDVVGGRLTDRQTHSHKNKQTNGQTKNALADTIHNKREN